MMAQQQNGKTRWHNKVTIRCVIENRYTYMYINNK